MHLPEASHSSASTPGRDGQDRAHVSVCICTYRRPALLEQLLEAVFGQATDELFTFSVVVADNDAARSGQPTVDSFTSRTTIPIVYCVESERNIALARNRAVEHARGAFVAWIDDDEIPAPHWLLTLFITFQRTGAAGVLGPVRPCFPAPPPGWLVAGRFCERPEYTTGTVMSWRQSFCGNGMVRRDVLRGDGPPFRPEFGIGGEDVDFFRRMALRGHIFVWCNEAVVHEVVPPARWTRRYRLKRAILLGRSSLKLNDGKLPLRSFPAIPAYLLCLPFALLLGQRVFMAYSIKLCSHLGHMLAWFGANPIRQRPD